ncbi:hypothetical protein F5146DRAFT_1137592 [Armillaria mellea]|nr:hypothetical protein F5146DRAFT_1137592 [Armillaria mellea]
MPQIPIDHDALRQGYLESPPNQGIYIGNPSSLSMHNLKWMPMNGGRGHVLVDTSHETPSHAILLVVLHITRKNCWVYPDGKWKGPTKYTESLADMKLNCFGEIPEAGVFRDDFQHVIRNLESIRNKIASPGSKKSGVLFPVEIGNPADENGLKVKFHHTLFKKLKSEGEGGPVWLFTTIAVLAGQHDWNMDNWPAVSDVAKKALKDMKTTHMVDPLPLYDSEDTPVNPKLYHSSLAGATVEVRFNLCHWHIENEDKDVYSAYIDSMYILPVPGTVVSHPGRKSYLQSPSEHGIYIGNPSALSTSSLQWLPMDSGGHVLADTSHEKPSHAILLTVLRISAQDCWVYPDGRWRGPTEYTKSFADTKLRCSGVIPVAGVFRDDFEHVIENLESIRNMIASPGGKKRGVLVPAQIGDPMDENQSGLKVKFQHEKGPREGGGWVLTNKTYLFAGQHTWTMENWPVTSDAAREALKDMKRTHGVDPLPLYDSEDTLVDPELYSRSLIGATVEVRFSLCHWRIMNEDVYVAYVDSMYILPVPAMVLSSPATKRRFVQAEPPLSPSKRLRPCEATLTEPDDVVVCSLHPSNDYKTSVLSGLMPSVILEICSRAISFWQYQIYQERWLSFKDQALSLTRIYMYSSFQQAVVRNLTDKNTQIQKQLDSVVREANSEISLLNNKIAELERDVELERRKVRELQDASRDRDREYQKLKAQHDKMKRKVLLAPNLSGQQASGNESLNLSSSSFPGQGEPNARQPLRTFGVGAVVDGMEANGIQRTPLVNRGGQGGGFVRNGSDGWVQAGGAGQRLAHRQPLGVGHGQQYRQTSGSMSERSDTSSLHEVENLLGVGGNGSGGKRRNTGPGWGSVPAQQQPQQKQRGEYMIFWVWVTVPTRGKCFRGIATCRGDWEHLDLRLSDDEGCVLSCFYDLDMDDGYCIDRRIFLAFPALAAILLFGYYNGIMFVISTRRPW